MMSQRSLARVSLQLRQFPVNERLHLLCYGSPLSALLLRLATAVDRSDRSSKEHKCMVCIMKRYFSGVAHRLWHLQEEEEQEEGKLEWEVEDAMMRIVAHKRRRF